MINIDGAMGEGGGQILCSSLALSICLALPFHLSNTRAFFKKTGLQPQYLAAVNAATTIANRHLDNEEFLPNRLRLKL